MGALCHYGTCTFKKDGSVIYFYTHYYTASVCEGDGAVHKQYQKNEL